MSKLDLDAIEARANAATPGKWMWSPKLPLDVYQPPTDREAAGRVFECSTAADAVFVTHARQDIPALVARVRELEAAEAERLAARSRSARLPDRIFQAGLDPRNPPRVESGVAPEAVYTVAIVERMRALEAAFDEAIDAIPTELPCEGDDIPANDDDAIALRDRLRAVLRGTR